MTELLENIEYFEFVMVSDWKPKSKPIGQPVDWLSTPRTNELKSTWESKVEPDDWTSLEELMIKYMRGRKSSGILVPPPTQAYFYVGFSGLGITRKTQSDLMLYIEWSLNMIGENILDFSKYGE
ncbi:MAG: hypothetical protein Alpg2KO_23490 [Alphaproteobacteria bacterium]